MNPHVSKSAYLVTGAAAGQEAIAHVLFPLVIDKICDGHRLQYRPKEEYQGAVDYNRPRHGGQLELWFDDAIGMLVSVHAVVHFHNMLLW